ncbi:MAG: MBL fold metallo-hydrolase [Phycisphaera sp.]|nr:MBL fold metallo-hydrolase [Phycisphaera sp.]
MKRIRTLDLRYHDLQGAAASHLIRTDDGPMLIETGPMSTLPILQRELEALEVDPESIELVVLTHIHLDHAGAAGWFAERGADVLVHPLGASHLVDPSRLNASARRIYGDELDTLFGEMHPCPEDRVHPIEDRKTISFGGIDLVAIETPGHARHHHSWMLDLDGMRQCFTGDVAGMRIPGSDFVTLPLAPPEFEPEAWIRSIDRLDSLDFDRLHLTHFGSVDDPARHLARTRDRVGRETDLVTRLVRDDTLDESARTTLYRQWLAEEADGEGIPEDRFRAFVNNGLLSMNLGGVRRHLQRTQPGE